MKVLIDLAPFWATPAGRLGLSRGNSGEILERPRALRAFPGISSKTRGPGEQGAAEYCPKILLLKRAKWCLSLPRCHREICTWMISAGPFLSRPLCFTADGIPLESTAGIPQAIYFSRHLKPPEHFQNSLPLSTAGDASFFQKWFRKGPLRTVVMEFPAVLRAFLIKVR